MAVGAKENSFKFILIACLLIVLMQTTLSHGGWWTGGSAQVYNGDYGQDEDFAIYNLVDSQFLDFPF